MSGSSLQRQEAVNMLKEIKHLFQGKSILKGFHICSSNNKNESDVELRIIAQLDNETQKAISSIAAKHGFAMKQSTEDCWTIYSP
jgi:hypothetical protein